MGSGINSSAQGKYEGNATELEIKPGFKPKKVKIWSANGSAEMIEGMTSAAKRVVAGDLTFVAGLEFTEFGFKVSGSDACLNANAVAYYYECY